MRNWALEERSKAARQLLERYRYNWNTYARENQDEEVQRTASGRGALALSFAVDFQCQVNLLREALEKWTEHGLLPLQAQEELLQALAATAPEGER